jgi:hypothetical protein
VRAAAWAFILCVVASAIGVFLPSFGAQAKGIGLGRKASLSLYQVASKEEFAEKLVVAYHKGAKTQLGAAVVATLTPKLAGKISSYLVDAGDAARTLDEVSDEDAGTLGTILKVTVYAFLGLHVVMLGLMFGPAIEDTFRRRRIVVALAVSVVVAAVAIALHWASRVAVAEANLEVGVEVLAVGAGAYLTVVAAVVAVIAQAAVLVLHIRHVRATRPHGVAPVAGPTSSTQG